LQLEQENKFINRLYLIWKLNSSKISERSWITVTLSAGAISYGVEAQMMLRKLQELLLILSKHLASSEIVQ